MKRLLFVFLGVTILVQSAVAANFVKNTKKQEDQAKIEQEKREKEAYEALQEKMRIEDSVFVYPQYFSHDSIVFIGYNYSYGGVDLIAKQKTGFHGVSSWDASRKKFYAGEFTYQLNENGSFRLYRYRVDSLTFVKSGTYKIGKDSVFFWQDSVMIPDSISWAADSSWSMFCSLGKCDSVVTWVYKDKAHHYGCPLLADSAKYSHTNDENGKLSIQKALKYGTKEGIKQYRAELNKRNGLIMFSTLFGILLLLGIVAVLD